MERMYLAVSKRDVHTVLLCISLYALSTFVAAQEKEPEQVTESTPSQMPQTTNSWLDNWHKNFSESMDFTAQQLDEFFALEGSDDHQHARSEGRVRFGWEPRTRDLAELDFRFRARVKLPALEDRVDLLFADDDNYNRYDTISASRSATNDNSDSTTIALRYKKKTSSPVSHRLGTGRRGQLFVRSRYAKSHWLDEQYKLEYDGEIYYYTRDQLGAELGINLTYFTTKDAYIRVKNRYFYRHKLQDWAWRHELQYLRPLTDKSALLYTFFTRGLTEPSNRVTELYTSVRWRTGYKRNWLFFEIEPFILLLREEHFSPSYGLAMRFEFYYGKI